MRVWYKVVNKQVVGIENITEFKQYISKHNGMAPKIPLKILKIAPTVFDEVFDIKNINIPTTIEELDPYLFKNSKNIRINIGDYYNLVLREITPDKKNKLNYKLVGIQNREKFEKYCIQNSGYNPVVPYGVASIADYVFKNCQNLKHLILPESIICICKQACANCKNLETVSLSKRFIDFGEEIFINCERLKTLNIPDTIQIIRANILKGCPRNLKINLFNRFSCSCYEFLLKGKLGNLENILATQSAGLKVLRTNNYLFIFDSNTCHRISKRQLSNKSVFNKQTGVERDDYYNVFDLFKGEELLVAYKESKKYNIPLPDDLIVSNLNKNEIRVYFKRLKIFERTFARIRELSNYYTLNSYGKNCKRLTLDQYNLILKVMCLTGFFEEKVDPILPVNFILRSLFGVEKGNYNSMNLSIEEFTQIFIALLKLKKISYNEEFCKYFLFNFNNLNKLIEALKNKKDSNFINLLIKNCGKSEIYYIHNGVPRPSNGLLHDKWINYKENNNNKQTNNNNPKKHSCLSFLDWSLNYGDGSHVFIDLKYPKSQIEKIKPFLKFYTEKEPLERLNEIFQQSEKIFPFVFYDETSPYFYTQERVYNIAKVDAEKHTKRNFEVLFCKDSKLEENLVTELKNFLHTDASSEFVASAVEKNSTEVAFANCEMGHCANVKANGCEYLYESYFDVNCQPFMIYRNENNRKIPVASFRVDINKSKGVCTITCLEVKSEVKFNYSYNQKVQLVKAFDEIIKKFILLYNKIFNKKINLITMGQITHCDVNEILAEYYKIGEGPYVNVKSRKIVAPSEYNHFIIYESREEV